MYNILRAVLGKIKQHAPQRVQNYAFTLKLKLREKFRPEFAKFITVINIADMSTQSIFVGLLRDARRRLASQRCTMTKTQVSPCQTPYVQVA